MNHYVKHCKRFSSLLVQFHLDPLFLLGKDIPSLNTTNNFPVRNLSKELPLVKQYVKKWG